MVPEKLKTGNRKKIRELANSDRVTLCLTVFV
jgi:hypothetical protein